MPRIHRQAPGRAFFCAGRSASALLPAPFASNSDGPRPMRTLSLAVALFALAAVFVGLRAPDVGVFLYAAAALLCAGATYRSAHISTFLRVFEVVFAVETIVFGVAYLADELGLWPQAYADYALPSSLPLTVALFGSLVYAVSHIPVVRKMTDIADPYFSERAPTTARIWPGRPCRIPTNWSTCRSVSRPGILGRACSPETPSTAIISATPKTSGPAPAPPPGSAP